MEMKGRRLLGDSMYETAFLFSGKMLAAGSVAFVRS